MHYTTKDLTEFSNSLKQKSAKHVWEWILRVLDNFERIIKLDQAEFTDMNPLNGDSWFNMEAHAVLFG